MRNYRNLLWLILISLFFFTGCNFQPKNNTNFSIPDGFEIVNHNSKFNEILSVKYKDEMMIIVSKSMSMIIKKGALFGPGVMKQSFEVKFPMLVDQHAGINLSEQNHYYVNENIYLNRSFEFMASSSEGYYEYGALHIVEPEEYYEFFITGDKSKKEKHKPIIKSFLEGVK